MKLVVLFMFCSGMICQSTGLAMMARYPRFHGKVNAYGMFFIGGILILMAVAHILLETKWL